MPYTQIGMFATKWLAKRFGPDASEIDPGTWDWSSYLKGGIGAVAAGFFMQMIKPGSGQRVMAGGLNLMAYKLIQNELIAGNPGWAAQFGADEDEDDYVPTEYMGGYDGYGGQDTYLPGDVETNSAGQPFLLGEDGQWHALPEETMGDLLEPVGPLGQLEPVGPLGQLEPVGPLGNIDAAYRKSLLDA